MASGAASKQKKTLEFPTCGLLRQTTFIIDKNYTDALSTFNKARTNALSLRDCGIRSEYVIPIIDTLYATRLRKIAVIDSKAKGIMKIGSGEARKRIREAQHAVAKLSGTYEYGTMRPISEMIYLLYSAIIAKPQEKEPPEFPKEGLRRETAFLLKGNYRPTQKYQDDAHMLTLQLCTSGVNDKSVEIIEAALDTIHLRRIISYEVEQEYVRCTVDGSPEEARKRIREAQISAEELSEHGNMSPILEFLGIVASAITLKSE